MRASMIVFLALFSLLSTLLGGCRGTPEEARRERHDRIAGYAERASREMVYVRDERTGLCYAFWWIRYDRSGSPAMTNVPCESVTAWLEPQ